MFKAALTNDTGPAVVDSNACTVNNAGSLAISNRSTESSNLIQVTERGLDSLIDSVHLLVTLDIDAGLERIGHVGVHAPHHQSITLDALVTVEGGSVLGQPDQTVFARSVGGT